MNVYPSKEYHDTLRENLQCYLISNLPAGTKPKREAQMKSTYDNIYSIQFGTVSIVNLIEASHLLGMNDIVIPHMVQEYAQLNFALKKLESELKKLKQYNEVSGNLDKINSVLKTKEVGKFLYDDLVCLSEIFTLKIDLKQCMDDFKSFTVGPELRLQLGIA